MQSRQTPHGLAAAALFVFAWAAPAHAAFFDRGNGLVYDNVLNITWMADLNHAQTSGHTGAGVLANGLMTWDAAAAWADNLSYGGYSDWRLPALTPSDASCTYRIPGFGFNCTGGELSHFFVTDLGNKPDESVLNTAGDSPQQLANQALFKNTQTDAYWAGTQTAPGQSTTPAAWYFNTDGGYQFATQKTNEFYAVAVRAGDVLSPVPEPRAWLLMLLGLGAVAVAARRKAR